MPFPWQKSSVGVLCELRSTGRCSLLTQSTGSCSLLTQSTKEAFQVVKQRNPGRALGTVQSSLAWLVLKVPLMPLMGALA